VKVSDHLQPRIVKAGEEFMSNDTPGRNWFPLDDEARAAFEARFHREPGRVRHRVFGSL
jgi:hypothetical protein